MSAETTQKVRDYLDHLDDLHKIIDDAYELYMPQVRQEIFDLTKLVDSKIVTKPFNILEIGTKFGGTFHIWNSLNKTGGLNLSIDMSDGGIHGGISDAEMDNRDKMFNQKFDNCRFVRGDSHADMTLYQLINFFNPTDEFDWPQALKIPKVIDFLFIDGDHSYDGVKQDFEMYVPFVKTGGIIAFHDIVISDRHHERNVYVGEFWQELTKVRPTENICLYDGTEYEFQEIIHGDGTWAGIGIITKL